MASIHPRAAVGREPFARLLDQFNGSVGQLVIARKAQQPQILGELDVDVRKRVDQFAHPTASCSGSNGLNWQPSTKKSKNRGCVSNRQCSTRLTICSNSSRRARESNAIDAPSIAALPRETNFVSEMFGIRPMRLAAEMSMCRPNPPAR